MAVLPDDVIVVMTMERSDPKDLVEAVAKKPGAERLEGWIMSEVERAFRCTAS